MGSAQTISKSDRIEGAYTPNSTEPFPGKGSLQRDIFCDVLSIDIALQRQEYFRPKDRGGEEDFSNTNFLHYSYRTSIRTQRRAPSPPQNKVIDEKTGSAIRRQEGKRV